MLGWEGIVASDLQASNGLLFFLDTSGFAVHFTFLFFGIDPIWLCGLNDWTPHNS